MTGQTLPVDCRNLPTNVYLQLESSSRHHEGEGMQGWGEGEVGQGVTGWAAISRLLKGKNGIDPRVLCHPPPSFNRLLLLPWHESRLEHLPDTGFGPFRVSLHCDDDRQPFMPGQRRLPGRNIPSFLEQSEEHIGVQTQAEEDFTLFLPL